MALTSGFFKAELVNDVPDRKYGSEEFGSLFDGVISDGIFENYGNAFKVTLGEAVTDGIKIFVGSGRAWFNKTWTLNSASYELMLPRPSPSYNVLYVVVLDINAHLNTRENSIKLIRINDSYTEDISISPTDIIRSDSDKNWQYILAKILVKASSSPTITTDSVSITNVIGTSTDYAAPYAKPIEPVTSSIDGIIDSLEQEFSSYKDTYQKEFNEWMQEIIGSLGTLSNEQTVRLALMIGEIYRSEYISGEYPYVDEDGGLWLSASDDGSKPSVDINFGYASLPYAANGRANEVVIQTSEYTIEEEE